MQKNSTRIFRTEPGDIDAEVFAVWSFGINGDGFEAAADRPDYFAETTLSGEIIWRKEFFRLCHVDLRRFLVNVFHKPLDRRCRCCGEDYARCEPFDGFDHEFVPRRQA